MKNEKIEEIAKKYDAIPASRIKAFSILGEKPLNFTPIYRDHYSYEMGSHDESDTKIILINKAGKEIGKVKQNIHEESSGASGCYSNHESGERLENAVKRLKSKSPDYAILSSSGKNFSWDYSYNVQPTEDYYESDKVLISLEDLKKPLNWIEKYGLDCEIFREGAIHKIKFNPILLTIPIGGLNMRFFHKNDKDQWIFPKMQKPWIFNNNGDTICYPSSWYDFNKQIDYGNEIIKHRVIDYPFNMKKPIKEWVLKNKGKNLIFKVFNDSCFNKGMDRDLFVSKIPLKIKNQSLPHDISSLMEENECFEEELNWETAIKRLENLIS